MEGNALGSELGVQACFSLKVAGTLLSTGVGSGDGPELGTPLGIAKGSVVGLGNDSPLGEEVDG